MSTEFAVPVKNLIKTWSRGSKLAKKFGKTASTVSAEEALEIAESVEKLQRSLERDSEAVVEVYKQCLELYGEAFAAVLVGDKTIQGQLKELRADLMDQVNEIQDVADEPEDFEVEIFTGVQTESKTISDNCIKALKDARDSLSRANLQVVETERDDRAALTSMRPREDSVSTEASFSTTAPSLRIFTPSTEMDSGPPPKPMGSWSIESPPPPYDPIQSQASAWRTRPIPEEKPVSTNPDDFITPELVGSRVQANLDFLERRKFARIAFNDEIRKSVCSVDEDRESTFSDIVSPISPSSLAPSEARPIGDGRRSSSNDYPAFVNSQRKVFSPSDRKRTSTTSSQFTTSTTPGDRHSASSYSNNTPEDVLFRQNSNAGSTKSSAPLAATLKIPGYGEGVQDGLILAEDGPVYYDSEKEIVPQNDPHYNTSTTPTSSMKSVDSPMRHDTSFYKFGGFCDGAITALRGELGYKVVKRPVGVYGSNDFARCLKCAYEVSMTSIGKDSRQDVTGIYGDSGIRWRQQFLTKSHVKTHSPDEPLYACVFCIEDRKTTDEHDATVFFSHGQLFQHIAKHPRPLATVPGINALYGRIDPAIVKFDLHFIKNDPSLGKYNMIEIAPLVQVRASATAITTYHPNNSRTGGKDPEGNPTLHFAEGARILGINFPEQFNGAWCTGYHDGSKGSFPSAAIVLDLPSKEDILMSAQSSLVATAKWEFKPKDAKEGGWLKFSRGDRITHIGYTFQDQWCWSGQTKNGKWGLFPMAFVEGLQEAGGMMGSSSMSSSASVKSRSGMMSLRKLTRTGAFPSRSGRSSSVRSGSSGKVPGLNTQPGLEVVVNGVSM